LPSTALIVGAGIGGLSAGIALGRAGWCVRIVERTPSPRELGFGLALAPNAIAALGELGVADAVLSRSCAPRRGEIRRPDGTVVKRLDLPPGGTTVVALRPALHDALLAAVGRDTVSLHSDATAFTVRNGVVTLRLASGEDLDGEVLVGADGVGSMVRRTLHPVEPPPRASGLVAVRGAVHHALHHLGDRDAIYYLGRGLEAMLVRASDTGLYWFLSMARSLLPDGITDPSQVMALMAPRFDATFRAVTSATEVLRFDELIDRDPLPAWGRGPVTLLGDAAHPLLPHTGQGAAQALVDAVTLGRVLRGWPDVAPALRRYEGERRPRTAVLLRQGRRTARLLATTHPLACALRDTVLRLIPVQTLMRFYVSINRRAGTR
jgi:2-polyprenyl-6-methoxyphenol hydroxylase-like FAD-dependent oxidoreductase